MRPNIVIIICDSLRPRDLSLYGNSIQYDKHIKQIAAESVVFKNNFTVSNASDVSVTSLFSSKYPSTLGFFHQHPNTKKEEITALRKNKFWFPIYLKKRGYSTFSATPLHLWFKKGFDTFMERKVERSILNNSLIKKTLLSLPHWAYAFGKKYFKARASPHFYSAQEVVDLAIHQMQSSEKPFFLFMHLIDSHYPYPSVQLPSIKKGTSLRSILNNMESPLQKEYIKKRFFDIGADYLEQIIEKRNKSILYLDKQLGRIYQSLKKEKLWDNTILVLLSDHGDNFGEHTIYLCRGGLYDSSVHVPFLMHVPGLPGKTVYELTQTIDVVPTLLELLKDQRQDIDGRSLLRIMKGGEEIRNTVMFFDGYAQKAYGIRSKKEKMILRDNSRCYLCGAFHGKNKEMYDLEKDPEELNEIYTEKNELEHLLKKIDY